MLRTQFIALNLLGSTVGRDHHNDVGHIGTTLLEGACEGKKMETVETSQQGVQVVPINHFRLRSVHADKLLP